MKRTARILALLLAAMTLLAAFPATSLAATTKTLQKSHWYNIPSSDKSNTYYKLKLTSDSILTVHWKNVAEWAGVNFYSRANPNSGLLSGSIHDRTNSDPVALAKGTYYISFEYGGLKGSKTPQMKFTVQKPANKMNFSKGRALSLASGKVVKIAQTADNSYNRWYKIKLTSKKAVTISAARGYTGSILLYNSKLQKVSCARSYNKVKSKKSLAKGTYYICVKTPGEFEEGGIFYDVDSSSHRVGHYITIKWS